jgi:hypothetical protein
LVNPPSASVCGMGFSIILMPNGSYSIIGLLIFIKFSSVRFSSILSFSQRIVSYFYFLVEAKLFLIGVSVSFILVVPNINSDGTYCFIFKY